MEPAAPVVCPGARTRLQWVVAEDEECPQLSPAAWTKFLAKIKSQAQLNDVQQKWLKTVAEEYFKSLKMLANQSTREQGRGIERAAFGTLLQRACLLQTLFNRLIVLAIFFWKKGDFIAVIYWWGQMEKVLKLVNLELLDAL